MWFHYTTKCVVYFTATTSTTNNNIKDQKMDVRNDMKMDVRINKHKVCLLYKLVCHLLR